MKISILVLIFIISGVLSLHSRLQASKKIELISYELKKISVRKLYGSKENDLTGFKIIESSLDNTKGIKFQYVNEKPFSSRLSNFLYQETEDDKKNNIYTLPLCYITSISTKKQNFKEREFLLLILAKDFTKLSDQNQVFYDPLYVELYFHYGYGTDTINDILEKHNLRGKVDEVKKDLKEKALNIENAIDNYYNHTNRATSAGSDKTQKQNTIKKLTESNKIIDKQLSTIKATIAEKNEKKKELLRQIELIDKEIDSEIKKERDLEEEMKKAKETIEEMNKEQGSSKETEEKYKKLSQNDLTQINDNLKQIQKYLPKDKYEKLYHMNQSKFLIFLRGEVQSLHQ